MKKTVLGVLAGYGTLVVIVVAMFGLATVMGWSPASPAFLAFNFTFDMVAAAAAGAVAAKIGREQRCFLILAGLLLVFGAIEFFQTRNQRPVWFSLIRLAAAPIAVTAGGVITGVARNVRARLSQHDSGFVKAVDLVRPPGIR